MTTLLEQQIRANEFQNKIMAELSDLSYCAFNGERQPARGFSNNITPLGQVPFSDNQAKDVITKEMIKDYQEEQQNHHWPTGEHGEKLKYYSITEDYALKTYTPILFGISGRVATEADIADGRNRSIELGDLLQTATYKLQDLELKENDLKAKIAAEWQHQEQVNPL